MLLYRGFESRERHVIVSITPRYKVEKILATPSVGESRNKCEVWGKKSKSTVIFFQPARLPDPPLSHIRQGRQTVHVPKCSSTLGIAIEGGANTKQPLPRIISIQPNGAAFQAGGLRIGQLIREVDGISLEG